MQPEENITLDTRPISYWLIDISSDNSIKRRVELNVGYRRWNHKKF